MMMHLPLLLMCMYFMSDYSVFVFVGPTAQPPQSEAFTRPNAVSVQGRMQKLFKVVYKYGEGYSTKLNQI